MTAESKKAQAGLEYLMTYGWALVLIATVIGVLVFSVGRADSSGRFSSSDPAKFLIKGGVLSGGAAKVKLLNATGGRVEITDCNQSCTVNGKVPSVSEPVEISSGGEATLACGAIDKPANSMGFEYTDFAGLERSLRVSSGGLVSRASGQGGGQAEGAPSLRFIQMSDAHIITSGSPAPCAMDGRTDVCVCIPPSPFCRGFDFFGNPEIYSKYCPNDVSIAPTIAMEKAVQVANGLKPDFVVFTGDSVAYQVGYSGGNPCGFDKVTALDRFKEIAGNLNSPYYVTGAAWHDSICLPECASLFEERWGYLNYNFAIEKNLFVFLSETEAEARVGSQCPNSGDKCCLGGDKTRINTGYLNPVLENYKDQGYTLFIFTHTLPLNTWDTYPLSMHRTILDTGLQASLGTYKGNYRKVILISGHNHANQYREYQGVHYVSTTALMNNPTEFRIFDITDSAVHIYMSGIIDQEISDLSAALCGGSASTFVGTESDREITINLG